MGLQAVWHIKAHACTIMVAGLLDYEWYEISVGHRPLRDYLLRGGGGGGGGGALDLKHAVMTVKK